MTIIHGGIKIWRELSLKRTTLETFPLLSKQSLGLLVL